MKQANDAPKTLPREKPGLGRHLIVVLVVKAILLTALWYVFIKPNRIAVDGAAMGSHIAGINPQAHLEKSHDRFDGR